MTVHTDLDSLKKAAAVKAVEFVRDGMVVDERARNRYHATITAEGERLGRLVDNVLELSRLEKGNRPMQVQIGSPRPAVEEVLAMLAPHAAAQGFALDLEADTDLPAVRYDRDALVQVLVNLVDNSLKFARDAERRRIGIALRADGLGVRLTVRDHGPGVPEADLRRIFEPFYRGERELTRRTKGTGIGLTLARGLIARMGGALRAVNAEGGGLLVEIRLA